MAQLGAIRWTDPSPIEHISGAHRHIPILNYLLTFSVLELQTRLVGEQKGHKNDTDDAIRCDAI